ncbi:hypothetical protein TCDM_07443 [Trypanosoma cruzi Dm28c]|uniref:Uncharacterized protein n=1 Tax=Trypanosoma cruzi Dm28c TaxID=1416333 RepID=V5AUH7_TRYCR|nr:hypothetical protein TCDM_07443 [Trypanosoma cruzi Dm28c]
MQEAEKTFRILQEALEKAVKFFSIGVTVDGVPLTQQQAVDVLDVYDTLLDAEEPESYDTRRYFLCRSLECGFMRFLAEILTQPFQHLHEFDAQVTQPFLPLRMKAIKALQRLLLACSEMGEDSCVSCFRVAVEEEIIPLLLRALSESPYEPLRLGAAETLFIFILRISHGRTGFVSTGGVNAMCRSLMGDGSHTVRSMCASILRELVNTHVAEFNNPATVKVILKSLEDTSADVRTLGVEILEQTLRLCTSSIAYVLQDAQSVLLPLRRILDDDPSVEVVVSAARLLETCCEVADMMHLHTFFKFVVSMGLVKVLLLRIRDGGEAGAARARGLRLLIQHTPASYELPRQIFHDTEVLAVLLKGIVDAGRGRTTPGEEFAVFQIKSLELAICVAIILTQSTEYREVLMEELKEYPQWAAAIKNAVISLLNAASLDYFVNIELRDVTGHHLNALHGVPWEADNTPQRVYIYRLFQEQAQRVIMMRENALIDEEAPSSSRADARDILEEEKQGKKVRLTFILLVFATNITFPVESQAAVKEVVDEPPSPQPRPGSRAVPRFPPSTLAGSKHRDHVLSSNGLVSPTKWRNKIQSKKLPDEKEAMAIAYDKFNSSMSFVMKFAQQFGKTKQKADDVVETEDGYFLRMSRLKNPWHAIVKHQKLKTWQVKDLRVGDLFYFSIPFDEIGIKALDVVLYKARRHMMYLKKELLITPHNSKGRRWFLDDMARNIMPKALEYLEDLKELIQSRGADGVRFPIFLFREKELHFGERALHPGNIVEVLDQIGFYFSQSMDKIVGVDKSRLQQLAEQLDNIEGNADMPDTSIHFCSVGPHDTTAEGMKLDTEEANEEDYDGGYGHGTISSDTESDF